MRLEVKRALKNAIMVQSGLYDDLETSLDKKVNQKVVSKDLNVTNCRALEWIYSIIIYIHST